MVALGWALTATPALAGVGLVASKGEPLRIVELPGPRGLLTSTSTRIPGLIAAGDLMHRERLGVLSVSDPRGRAERLQRRFEQLHGARRWAYVLLAALTAAAVLAALVLRRPFWGRFCVAIAPALLAVALFLSLAGAARPVVILPVLALGGVVLAAAVAVPRRLIVYIGPAILLLFFVVLWARPETAGFSSIGPRPEEGGRFFGVNNLVETVLLTMALFSAAELGLLAVLPLAALALVTVGWSRTGADGGGLIVFAAAFAFLDLRLAGRITLRRLALAAITGVGIVLAFIGVDELSGGHSHVTRAFEQGPVRWFGDIGHRLHVSVDQLASWNIALVVAAGGAVLAWLAFRRPRLSALDALLLGVAVSLLVNDSPSDVVGAGSLSGLVLFAWAATRYTRARALADPDPGLGSTPGRRLRRRGHGPRAPGHGDRDDPDAADRAG
jgi:hypothetical protein